MNNQDDERERKAAAVLDFYQTDPKAEGHSANQEANK